MSHYGLLKDYQFREATDDIRGAKLYGRDDEKLGKIDDVIFDHTTGTIAYLVVDTGGWLTSKKFVVPANRVDPSVKHEGDFESDLTKRQIETLPPYDEKDVESEEKWADYEGRYRSKWETGPVMHRAETDRNITPTTQQMQGNPPSATFDRDVDRESAATPTSGRVVPAGTDSVVIDNSATGISGRWDTFQARLRERRKEAVMGCQTCSIGPAAARGDSADTLKKAI
jgi:hypothetical protein